MLEKQTIEKLLANAGHAINANNGRCAVIEDVLCEVTTLCVQLLNGMDNKFNAKDVDMVGDQPAPYARPAEIRSFEYWWHEIQKHCEPSRWSGRELGKIAWNAAVEKCARECGAMQLAAASVEYHNVCRQFQV